jgi:hypothetical protein
MYKIADTARHRTPISVRLSPNKFTFRNCLVMRRMSNASFGL